MVVLSPIPKSVLCDSITYRLAEDSDYGGSYGEPATINRVRFEGAETLQKNGYVLESDAVGLVFIDAVNSNGAAELPAGTLVSVNGGDEIPVKSCSTLKGFNGVVHHWEVVI